MNYRIFGLVFSLISILVLPYWVFIPVLFIAIIIFPYFWEGILLALLIDVLYASRIGITPLLISPMTISVFILLIILIPIRERLRLHSSS